MYCTSNMPLAAFLLMKGVLLVDVKRNKSKFEFCFEGKEKITIEELEQEYVMSDFPKFDASVRQLKSKLYRDRE